MHSTFLTIQFSSQNCKISICSLTLLNRSSRPCQIQFAIYGLMESSEITVNSGVPQDSLLGPTQFLLSMNGIGRDNDEDILIFLFSEDPKLAAPIDIVNSDTNKLQAFGAKQINCIKISKSALSCQYQKEESILHSFIHMVVIIRRE